MTESVTGFVNVLKPTGMTSFEVVSKIKKIYKTKKVGHLGTLDPAASGVLPIAIGKATKFFDYFLTKEKKYVALVKFGVQTDTLDSFGNITKTINCGVKENEIKNVLKNFISEIYQTPPKYSAIKIDGKKAYELARKNVDFLIKPRKITIFNIKLTKKCEKNLFLFEVHCSAGTYIRTLFDDIAKSLGVVSTTVAIIRTMSGKFKINKSKTLEEIEKEPKVISIEELFDNLNVVSVDGDIAKKLINGVKVKASAIGLNDEINNEFLINFNGKLIGLYKINNDFLEPIVFVYEG